MGNIFAASEVVELGIQIEKNGRDFYKALVRKTKDKKMAGIFEYLAGEEEKHISVFKGILDTVARYEPPEAYPGEYFAYLSDLAGDYVFTKKDKGAQIAMEVKGDREAVDLGIGFEKDSIVFYEGMKKVVPSYDVKTVDGLIAQEQSHLRQLIDLKNKLLTKK
ncbi:MAG: ferritin family protein [Candidatus Omnitrophica bacterium]|nr:ferritin family protein [Candidatus Omnitrophota bacterium]